MTESADEQTFLKGDRRAITTLGAATRRRVLMREFIPSRQSLIAANKLTTGFHPWLRASVALPSLPISADWIFLHRRKKAPAKERAGIACGVGPRW
jgi:hypothetical protein